MPAKIIAILSMLFRGTDSDSCDFESVLVGLLSNAGAETVAHWPEPA